MEVTGEQLVRGEGEDVRVVAVVAVHKRVRGKGEGVQDYTYA